ncbi:MAG: type IV secretory system conjugative DNA transfer family protein [Bacteroidota bacterium]
MFLHLLWNQFHPIVQNCFLYLASQLEKKSLQKRFGAITLIGSVFNRGLLVSTYHKLTKRQSYQNVLISGPTGSGKTSRLLIPMLMSLIKDGKSTVIVNDPSGEIFQNIATYASKTHTIKTLNFSNSAKSSGYNILSRVTTFSGINKVSEMLTRISLGESTSDKFWELQTKSLLRVLLSILLHQNEEYKNMANLKRLLNAFAINPQSLIPLVEQCKSPDLHTDFTALCATPEKTLQNIVASAQASLEIFTDPEIAQVTSYDSIDFQELRRTPTILFLHNSIGDMRYISPIQSIFFEQLYSFLLQSLPELNDLDIAIILEEASSLHIPVLPIAISNTRKSRVVNVICIQSHSQLRDTYHDSATSILSNCVTKIMLPGQTDIDALKELEMLAGHYQDNSKDRNQATQSIISASEIRMIKDDEILILSSNKPLIKATTKPYYKSIRFNWPTQLPVYQLPIEKYGREIKILPLD